MLKSNSFRRASILACALSSVLSAGAGTAHADDFGNIVHHIEARYHVHRNHRFLMGFAGIVVKFWHVGGVKSLKIALFEDQHFGESASDVELDEIVQAADRSGWQPLVRSFSRHSGEHTYLYARYRGNDLQLLLLNLESREAVVAQVKVDPEKLVRFIDRDVNGTNLLAGKRHAESRTPRSEVAAQEAAVSTEAPYGRERCLFFPTEGDDLP